MMDLSSYTERHTVIFLLNSRMPTHILLLKRSPEKELAPNRITGIGEEIGYKEEYEDETPHQGAIRKLKEETGITDCRLTEFGCVRVNGNAKIIFYFFGIYNIRKKIPPCTEGKFNWLRLSEVLQETNKDLTPATRILLEEWSRRKWSNLYFHIIMRRVNTHDIDSPILFTQVNNGKLLS